MSANGHQQNSAEKLLRIPVYRVRTIMKSSPDVENIGQESLSMITKATELFVEHLATLALSGSRKENTLEYSDLAEIVQEKQNMEFLHDIIPRKILARDYWNIMKKVEKEDCDNVEDYI